MGRGYPGCSELGGGDNGEGGKIFPAPNLSII